MTTQYLLIVLLVVSVNSFQPTSFAALRFRTALCSSSGKGFGAAPPPKQPKKDDDEEKNTSVVAAQQVQPPQPMNAGQQALQEMRRQRAEERDAELRKVKELREMDRAVTEAPAAIPEKVANRMGQRMLPFVGIPLFLSLGAFVTFWYLATYKDLEFEPSTVAGATIALLVVGLLGITYSIFSTSWDEDREGDLMGLDEAKKNLGNIKEGLGRSRENAIMREKMSGLSESEIDRAIADLDRRDARKEKKKKEGLKGLE